MRLLCPASCASFAKQHWSNFFPQVKPGSVELHAAPIPKSTDRHSVVVEESHEQKNNATEDARARTEGLGEGMCACKTYTKKNLQTNQESAVNLTILTVSRPGQHLTTHTHVRQNWDNIDCRHIGHLTHKSASDGTGEEREENLNKQRLYTEQGRAVNLSASTSARIFDASTLPNKGSFWVHCQCGKPCRPRQRNHRHLFSP